MIDGFGEVDHFGGFYALGFFVLGSVVKSIIIIIRYRGLISWERLRFRVDDLIYPVDVAVWLHVASHIRQCRHRHNRTER